MTIVETVVIVVVVVIALNTFGGWIMSAVPSNLFR